MKIDHTGSWINISEILWVSPIVNSQVYSGYEEFEIQFKRSAPTSSITVTNYNEQRHPGVTRTHFVKDIKQMHSYLIQTLQAKEDETI